MNVRAFIRWTMGPIVIALALLVLSIESQGVACAQEAKATVDQMLSGGSERTWFPATRLKPPKYYISAELCGSQVFQRQYIFGSNHLGVGNQCIDEKITHKQFKWKVLDSQSGENVVLLGSTRYEVRFRYDNDVLYARFRPIVPQGTVIEEFVLQFYDPARSH